MRSILAFALAVAAALGAAGCSSTGTEGGGAGAAAGPGDALGMTLKNYQVVWIRGGKLGYLKTYDAAKPGETSVVLHHVEDLDFRQVGWISDDGQGERFDYPERKIREAYRTPFERVALPVDTIENQVRRIFRLDPATEIALRPAMPGDVGR